MEEDLFVGICRFKAVRKNVVVPQWAKLGASPRPTSWRALRDLNRRPDGPAIPSLPLTYGVVENHLPGVETRQMRCFVEVWMPCWCVLLVTMQKKCQRARREMAVCVPHSGISRERRLVMGMARLATALLRCSGRLACLGLFGGERASQPRWRLMLHVA